MNLRRNRIRCDHNQRAAFFVVLHVDSVVRQAGKHCTDGERRIEIQAGNRETILQTDAAPLLMKTMVPVMNIPAGFMSIVG